MINSLRVLFAPLGVYVNIRPIVDGEFGVLGYRDAAHSDPQHSSQDSDQPDVRALRRGRAPPRGVLPNGGTAKAQRPGRCAAGPGSHPWIRISGIPPGAEDRTRAGRLPPATPPDNTARHMLLRPPGARPRRGRTCPFAPCRPLLARPGLSGSAEMDRESNRTWAARERCERGVPPRPRTPRGNHRTR